MTSILNESISVLAIESDSENDEEQQGCLYTTGIVEDEDEEDVGKPEAQLSEQDTDIESYSEDRELTGSIPYSSLHKDAIVHQFDIHDILTMFKAKENQGIDWNEEFQVVFLKSCTHVTEIVGKANNYSRRSERAQ